MALNQNKFGVVTTTASKLLENIDKLQNGKLYFVAGDSSGVVKQGIYGLSENQTADGLITQSVSLFGTGGVADGNGYGLSQENFTTAFKTKLNGIADNANNYIHPESTVTAGRYGDTGTERTLSSSAPTFKVIDASVDASGHITAFASKEITLPSSAFTDDSVTSADKHYAPSADDASKITVSSGKYITGLTRDNKGHIVGFTEANLPKVENATNADHATNADNASTAEKVSQSFDVSFNGADILSFNGSANKTLAFVKGANIDITNSNGTLTIATTGVPTITEMNKAISDSMGNLAGALVYKGTISATNGLPSNASTGWTYVASASFVYNDGSNDWAVESGDMFIYNGTKWNIVSGENQIENKGATLTPGSNNVVLATVDGTDIKVNIPALPAIVNSFNGNSGVLTSDYDTSIESTSAGAYRAGTLNIAGQDYVLYGKDTVYEHPVSISGTTDVSSSDGGDFAFSSTNKTLQVITAATRDASGHIGKVVYKDITLPETAYSDTVYEHPVVGVTDTAVNTSTLTDVTLASGTEFTVVNGVYRDASGHVNKVSTTKYTLPASAFTDTKCVAATLNADSSADVPTGNYVDVISNVAISMSGDGTSLTGNMTAVRVATEAAVAAAQEAATIYWETL